MMLDLNLSARASSLPAEDAGVPETTAVSFEQDVLHPSLSAPVIVQFWAPWCGPCKQLKPLLDAAVALQRPALRMVRVNIETSPDLAQALRVQSVPTVYAFFQGQPVDGFVGLRPESEIKAFVERLVKLGGAGAEEGGDAVDAAARDKLLQQAADFLTGGAVEDALAAYSTAYDLDPESAAAMRGIAWCLLALGETDAFCALADDLSDTMKQDPALRGILWLRARATAHRPTGSGQVEGMDDDKAAAFADAQARLARLEVAESLERLLDIVRKDKDWNGGAAREEIVEILDALGPDHPLTRPVRRQLSSVLFA